MSRCLPVLCALALWLPATAAHAAEPTDLLGRAIDAYRRGLETEPRDLRLEQFRTAERLFAQASHDGIRTPELYTNLGNAALQSERLGPAILAYRRALELDPDHERAHQNLEHARSLLAEWVPRPVRTGLLDTFFFWHRTLSRAERSLAAAACFALALALLALSIRSVQPTLRTLAFVPGLAWVALLASLLFDPRAGVTDDAVVTTYEVVARVADSTLAPSPFPVPIPGGTEVRVLEERSPWARIRLANGRDAWVAASALTRIVPDSPRL